jgi:hypothetical protein
MPEKLARDQSENGDRQSHHAERRSGKEHELAHLIRLRWPSLRVVLTSGYSHVLSEPGDHPFELIPKPYSMEDLASLLSTSAEKLSDLS